MARKLLFSFSHVQEFYCARVLFVQELKQTFEELDMPVSDAEVRHMMAEVGIQDSRIFFEGK